MHSDLPHNNDAEHVEPPSETPGEQLSSSDELTAEEWAELERLTNPDLPAVELPVVEDVGKPRRGIRGWLGRKEPSTDGELADVKVGESQGSETPAGEPASGRSQVPEPEQREAQPPEVQTGDRNTDEPLVPEAHELDEPMESVELEEAGQLEALAESLVPDESAESEEADQLEALAESLVPEELEALEESAESDELVELDEADELEALAEFPVPEELEALEELQQSAESAELQESAVSAESEELAELEESAESEEADELDELVELEEAAVAEEAPLSKPTLAMPLPRVIAIANQKGGVGKTTTTVNVAACLAEQGYRTLLVDLDPQANASTGVGLEPRELEHSIYNVLLHGLPADSCIEPTEVKNLFVLPSSLDLAGAEIELVSLLSREHRLRMAIESVIDDYDYVLIDCPPALGLLTINALTAAHEVLVPIQCEYYALEGLGQLVRNIDLVKASLNPELQISHIVLVMFDPRTKLAGQVVDEVRLHFGETVCQNVIPRTVRLSEAPSFGQPITTFDSGSRGAAAYRAVTQEVLNAQA